jgi:hypothetical protein
MLEIIKSWSTPMARGHKLFQNHHDIVQLAQTHTTEDDKQNNRFINGMPFIDNPVILELKSWFLQSVHEVASQTNPWDKDHQPTISDMWSWSSNDYDNLLHGHHNCSWSGVYCVEEGNSTVEGYNGSTIMFSPLPWGGYSDPGNLFLEKQFLHWHHLSKGDLLLFPSYVRHSAKYKGTVPRTVIAFNITFK